MPSITEQHIGKYTYLNLSESFWDADKKRPDNKKIRIGKIDRLTGEPVYTKDYLDRLIADGKSIDGMRLWDKQKEERGNATDMNRAAAEELLCSVKDYGTMYFLRGIGEAIGVIDVLRAAIPDRWEDVFFLACYLISSDKPFMYCDDWASTNEGPCVSRLSSQRVSDLLAAFGCAERAAFYKEWYRHIRAREYVALDITSVSSYSEQITECEWGYNRDGENLPQVNICMLFGEETKLPVYQTTYSGSLRDVSTLDATVLEFEALTGGVDVTLVMDKGFFSAKNIGLLLGSDKRRAYRFIVAVPFTSNFAKEQVRSERKDIDKISNVVFTAGQPIRGVHKLRAWPGGHKLHTHIFFNPEKETKDRNELYGYVARLKSEAERDPENAKLQSEYNKYLIVRKSGRTAEGVTVNIREEVVASELETAGWFILISNYVDNAQIAHDIYRAKDVVEKSFLKYKNNLGLGRLRVHGDERMQNKRILLRDVDQCYVFYVHVSKPSSLSGIN